MTSAAALLPTRKDEDFRYADLAALERVWPVAIETIALAEGEHRALRMVNSGVRELAIVLAPGASLDLHVLNAGPTYGRLALRAELGAGSQFTFGAAQLAGSGQVLEVVTHVAHLGLDAISQQTVRSVAGGGSTVNYLGKVHVAKGADGTDGSQSVRAMLLDRQSAANAKPELEIHADDVKCAHGCAVGELDKQALFYLAQRGLPPEAAKKLMLQAFVAEAFVGAADEEALQAQALAALEAML
ncbi:MAG: SufD family Fe-S cluster assembly protein [Novosphingobium sp.]|nr:SufD family Fe-S cluster assembly protein [Novosphingobium sp.]